MRASPLYRGVLLLFFAMLMLRSEWPTQCVYAPCTDAAPLVAPKRTGAATRQAEAVAAAAGLQRGRARWSRQRWAALPSVLVAAAVREADTASARASSSSRLSLLQSYLYSAEATQDAAVLGSGGTQAEDEARHGGGRRVVPQSSGPVQSQRRHNVVSPQGLADAPPSSQPSSSAPASGASSAARLAAALSGRYVVLSRTPASAPARPGTQSASMLHTGLQDARQCDASQEPHRGRCVTAPVVLLATGDLEVAAAASPLAAAAVTPLSPQRVFPEVALRRVASTTAAFAADPQPGPTAAPQSPASLRARPSRAATPLAEAEAATSAAAKAPALEVHHIDATHILVFLPEGSTEPLLQALAADGDGGAWRLWDAFQSREGAQLKVSERLLHALAGPAATGEAASLQLLPLEVTLWTAHGMAATVRDALETAPRLQRFVQPAPQSRAAAQPCRLELLHAEEAADAVAVRLVEAAAAAAPGSTSPHSPDAVRQCASAALLSAAAHPAVRWVEETARRVESLNHIAASVIQYGHCSSYALNTTLPSAAVPHPFWSRGWNGTGEIVAVSDSGVDTGSCFFHDPAEFVALYPSVNPRHRKILSYQAFEQNGVPVDATDRVDGHGTHVATTAVGCALADTAAPPAADMTQYNGVAPAAKLFVRDLAPSYLKTLLLPLNPVDIFQVSYDVGARISSNSWGLETNLNSYLAIERMVDRFVAERRDMLILIASGNSPHSGLYAPGRAKNVLTVGAHPNSVSATMQDVVSEFSAHGPTYDGRRKPDLIAPGGGRGTRITSGKSTSEPQCATLQLYGTSMATAAAAGAAALVRQYLREHWHLRSPSAALLRAALVHSATPIRGGANDIAGFGRLDLSSLLPHEDHSVSAAGLATLQHWFLDDDVVRDGEVRQYCFRWSAPAAGGVRASDVAASSAGNNNNGAGGGGGVESCQVDRASTVVVTLAWSDPATALEGSRRSQVHDLDLMVVTRRGAVHYSTSNGKPDRSNTVEQVRVPIPAGGASEAAVEWAAGFRVLVWGAEVRNPAGQAYALTVSAPGLAAVSDCAELIGEWGSTTTTIASSTPTAASCPLNCSRHGSCDPKTLLCACDANYTSVECAECNADVVCHGHGTCAAPSMKCTCDPRGHFTDAACSRCTAGWYGPLCDSTCECRNGGVCDKSTGLCTCVQRGSGPGASCFAGDKCQYCCENHAGDACDQRSYWCDTTGTPVLVDNETGGYIQVDGYESYPYSITCRWTLQAQPGQQVQIGFIAYDIEEYDALNIYDVVTAVGDNNASNQTRHLMQSFNGKMNATAPVLMSTANRMDLEFTSDWDGVAPGFLLFYRFTACSGRCLQANRTGQPGHWQCGDGIGLPMEQCLCTPPYVGWHCSENAAAASALQTSLALLSTPSREIWDDGLLSWMLPRSNLAVAETRLPVSLADAAPAAWLNWSASTALASELTVPVLGLARAPLVVHGFTELQIAQLTLPTAATFSSEQPCAQGGRQRVLAEMRLTLRLLVDRAWLDRYVGPLALTLGVTAATKAPPTVRASGAGTSAATATVNATTDAAMPLSFTSFVFTPVTVRELYYCPDAPEIELTVPLHAVAASPLDTSSRWATRVVLSLFWKAAPGLAVANETVLDAVVLAQSVTLRREQDACASGEGGNNTAAAVVVSTAAPSAGSTIAGKPVPMHCRNVQPVSAATGRRLVEHVRLRTPPSHHVSWWVALLLLGIALGVGAVGGALHVLLPQCKPWELRRSTYAVVVSVEEAQEMDAVGSHA